MITEVQTVDWVKKGTLRHPHRSARQVNAKDGMPLTDTESEVRELLHRLRVGGEGPSTVSIRQVSRLPVWSPLCRSVRRMICIGISLSYGGSGRGATPLTIIGDVAVSEWLAGPGEFFAYFRTSRLREFSSRRPAGHSGGSDGLLAARRFFRRLVAFEDGEALWFGARPRSYPTVMSPYSHTREYSYGGCSSS